MAGLKILEVAVWIFCLEIVPGEKAVEGVEIFPFRYEELLPGTFYLLCREDREKHIDLRKVEIAHSESYKLIVTYVFRTHRIPVVRPESAFRNELFEKVGLYAMNVLFIPDFHIAKLAILFWNRARGEKRKRLFFVKKCTNVEKIAIFAPNTMRRTAPPNPERPKKQLKTDINNKQNIKTPFKDKSPK